MKPYSILRIGLALVLSLVAVLAAPVMGVFAVALPVLAFLNLAPVGYVFGTSYPVINTTTAANLVADTAKTREEKWVRRIIQGSDYLYQDAPLADGFTGRMVQGEKSDPREMMKAVIQLTETEQLAGNTINVPTYAGFGGGGVFGEGNRIGSEQKIKTGTFPVTIGRGWFGVGYTGVAKEETMLGGTLDRIINDGLRALHAKKKSDDHFMRLRQAAGEEGTGSNNMLPAGITSIATLKGANVLDTVMISSLAEELPGLGALPMSTTTDSGGSYQDLFLLVSPDRALRNLPTESAYLEGLKYADVRGDANAIFSGGFKKWAGNGIYNSIQRDHGNKGPIGGPLCPRARLGVALTGATTSTVVQGGGLVYDSTDVPTRNYFEFFRNAPYTFYSNTNNIAADVSTTRYIKIINNDGTGWNVYSYQVNTGAAITILARITTGLSGEGSTHNHPQGSVILECNVLGQPFNRAVMLGAQSLVCGAGSINGSKADPMMGRRTEEHRNHDMDHAIGAEGVWGNAVTKRQDGAYPNFILATVAIADGQTAIT